MECMYTFAEQSDFHKIKLRGVNFDSPQQLIPIDLACIRSGNVTSILKLTRKQWSSLVSKKLTQPHLWLLDYRCSLNKGIRSGVMYNSVKIIVLTESDGRYFFTLSKSCFSKNFEMQVERLNYLL